MKKGTLNDQMNITMDMSNVEHYANGNYFEMILIMLCH